MQALLRVAVRMVDKIRQFFDRHEFTRPASAGDVEMMGTHFDHKYRREGRPFYRAVLRMA